VEQDQLLFVPMLSHQDLSDAPIPQRRGGSGPTGVTYFKIYNFVAAVCTITYKSLYYPIDFTSSRRSETAAIPRVCTSMRWT
jgi:hypothetical protein